jgi:hypothetical protein
MQKWNLKQAELADISEDGGSDSTKEDFSDLSRMACLLCQRKFKGEKDLRRHEDLSELHKVGRLSQFNMIACYMKSTTCALILTT